MNFFRIYISSQIFENIPQKGPEYSHRNLAIARFLVTSVRKNIGGLLSWLVSLSSSVPELTRRGLERGLQVRRRRTTTRWQRDMAGRVGIFSCVYALILFLSLTQFAKSKPTLQENRKFLILKDFSWSRRFLIPIYANLCNQSKTNWSAILVWCCM